MCLERNHMKCSMVTVFAASAAISCSAFAGGIFSEIEDNNSLFEANYIGMFDLPGGSIAIDGFLSTGDVDWFEFALADTASLSFFAAFGSSGDGIMQIVTGAGDVIAFDDDSSVGFMPAIQIENLAAGTYFIGFSGYGDVDASSVTTDELADGIGHQEEFIYKLSVGFTVVPAPGSLALLGMGGMVATRRRR